MDPRRSAFTLIEILIVLVVIGILAAIAIPKYSHARERSYLAAVQSDLVNLATQQEVYHSDHQTYASTMSELTDYLPTSGVTVTINEASGTGWAATAVHAALAGKQCGIFVGDASVANASPATLPGTVTCQN